MAKEMIYQNNKVVEILDRGRYKNYFYVVMSLGTHPCGYVKVPSVHPYYNKNYIDLKIECHGGLTYSRDYLRTSMESQESGWWIGWDYAHYGDYCGGLSNVGYNTKYTTDEIRKDCINVIEQLIMIEEEHNW